MSTCQSLPKAEKPRAVIVYLFSNLCGVILLTAVAAINSLQEQPDFLTLIIASVSPALVVSLPLCTVVVLLRLTGYFALPVAIVGTSTLAILLLINVYCVGFREASDSVHSAAHMHIIVIPFVAAIFSAVATLIASLFFFGLYEPRLNQE